MRGKKIDLGLWIFMAVLVVLIVLLAQDGRTRRTALVGESRPYPYVQAPAIVAQRGVQDAHILNYVVWSANIGTWRSQDAQGSAKPYRQYIAQDGVSASQGRRRDAH